MIFANKIAAMKKTVIVQLKIQTEKINDFINIAEIMRQESNKEEDCLSYKLLRDLKKINEFLIYEEYKNEQAVKTHNSSVHLKTFLNAVTPILVEEPIMEMH